MTNEERAAEAHAQSLLDDLRPRLRKSLNPSNRALFDRLSRDAQDNMMLRLIDKGAIAFKISGETPVQVSP